MGSAGWARRCWTYDRTRRRSCSAGAPGGTRRRNLSPMAPEPDAEGPARSDRHRSPASPAILLAPGSSRCAAAPHRRRREVGDRGGGPERKVVTVLFADLVGSTAMSDRLEPAVLARVLNGYFQRMSDAIHEHRGHVAHFLGDGIVAYFGALQPNPWQCNDAVRAALAMR